MQPAILRGYSRYPVKNALYPGIVRHSEEDNGNNNNNKSSGTCTSAVKGILCQGLTIDRDVKILDYFEDVEYTRINVHVDLITEHYDKNYSNNKSNCESSVLSVSVPAQVYLWTNPIDQLDTSATDWDYDKFCRDNLNDYLVKTVIPCREELEKQGLILPLSQDFDSD